VLQQTPKLFFFPNISDQTHQTAKNMKNTMNTHQ